MVNKVESVNRIVYVTQLIYLICPLLLFPIMAFSNNRDANIFNIEVSFFLLFHFVWGVFWIANNRGEWLYIFQDMLLAVSLIVFLFTWFYAQNANLDYVQRFIATEGKLNLALNTEAERTIVLQRWMPFIVLNLIAYGIIRLENRVRSEHWVLLLVLGSGVLLTLSMPSIISEHGIGIFGFVALIPLFFVLPQLSFGKIILYGAIFGAFSTLLTYHWLATFNLISLQIVVCIYLLFHMLLFAVIGWLLRWVRMKWLLRAVMLTVSWVLFEYLRSSGFLGFPWALAAHSQYRNPLLIQIAALTGVWGVSAVVVVVNALGAEAVWLLIRQRYRVAAIAGGCAIAIPLVLMGIGGLMIIGGNNRPIDRTVTIAAIQQNSDPRKHDYSKTFEALTRLTDRALRHNPDLVVWPETAFVPNIRFWSDEARPPDHPYVRLVAELSEYLHEIKTYLVTGNDDYMVYSSEQGTVRDDYNAAILFSDRGNRLDTYHKIKLVPFIEHFPYGDQFPRFKQFLSNFDIHFWKPGTTYTVFRHPQFRFSTPICFEDAFPHIGRRFTRAGAEVIINLSNDYWALTPVEARQHFAAAMFRTVENRRPLVRATASGETAYVDSYGRIRSTAPQYRERLLIARWVFQRSSGQRCTLGPETGLSFCVSWSGSWWQSPIFLLLSLGGPYFRRF